MERIPIKNRHWLETTREYYRWKSTPEFEVWRKKQFLKQGGLCWYCQNPLWLSRQNVEHKLARSRGGRNNKNNLVLACSTCNKDKGSSVLSLDERTRLNALNKKNKGTYLKNRAYYDKLMNNYSEDAILDVLVNL